ncbi:uncharacterized protein PG986_009230 [Apiospora aurea]|uniref:Golgi to ER traffic protein 2 n=1 Tax=Apiospora aurea TaxID=335848 RepID=A0ABR1Q7E8_9PEZI
MTETVQAPEDAAAARAAEQARLRKERREAKIRAGGTARLNKITGLGGGLQRDPEPQAAATQPASTTAAPTTTTQATSTPTATAPNHDDPEEVDISQHYYAPRKSGGAASLGDEPAMSESQLRQMMLGFERAAPPGIGTPPSRNPYVDPSRAGAPSGMPLPMPPGMEGMENDPMMQMLQSMMAGGGAPGGGANPFAGTGMESLLGGLGGMGGMGAGAGDPNMQQAAHAVADKTANIWRIIHAVFALALGVYVALSTTFTGLKSERDMLALHDTDEDMRKSASVFFYLFSSVEAILLTSRYFLDKHRSPPSGIAWTLVGFLPSPLSSTIRDALRYGQMFSTVRNDALVCVFVLGVCCWLRA